MIYWEVLPALVLNSIQDIRKRKIFLILTILWGVAGLALQMGRFIFQGGFEVSWLIGPGIGLLFLAISLVSRGRIGIGDGIAVCSLAFYLSTEELSIALLLASILVGLVAAIILIVKKNPAFEIPFIPFLSAGTLLALLGESI